MGSCRRVLRWRHLISTLKNNSGSDWLRNCGREAIADIQENMVAETIVGKWTWEKVDRLGPLLEMGLLTDYMRMGDMFRERKLGIVIKGKGEEM